MTKKKAPGPIPVCATCGEPHRHSTGVPACTGHSRGRLRPEIAGKACRALPLKGQKVCRVHGGAAPAAKAAAEVRVAQAAVAALAASLADSVPGEDQDPGQIIVESIRLQYRLTAYFWSRVVALDPRAFIWGKTREKVGGDDGGLTFEPKAHAWFVLWRESRRELDRLCLEAVKVGLEERRVRLAEQEADIVIALVDGLLEDFGIDPNDPRTAEIVERRLQLVG